VGLVGLTALLRWQWVAYWRRIFRGGTAARSNLIVLGLLSAAGFARYVTFLRDVSKQTAAGNYGLLDLLLAGLLVVAVQPGWDAAGLAFSSRDMARFPLAPPIQFGLRVLSRFVAPAAWIFTAVCASAFWVVASLPHPTLAIAAYGLLMLAGFAIGLALKDFSNTSLGSKVVRLAWAVLAVGAAAAWVGGVRTLPALPSHLIVVAGNGSWLSTLACGGLACLGVLISVGTLPWMLRHAPAGERSGRRNSVRTVTLFRRELRLQATLTEVRTAWVICVALGVYLGTADHPQPDALRVMLGLLAFLSIAVAMNSFGLDGVAGLDRFLIWPVSGTRIFLEKNKAFLVILVGPILPLLGLAAWRFGWEEGLCNGLEALAIALCMLTWGNMTSVRHPENASSASGGNVLDQFIAMAAVAIPTAASIGLLRALLHAAILPLLGLVCVAALTYSFSLRWSARYFAMRHEQMRRQLT
jgi:hypothetical protein